jgi:putative transposase
MPCCETPIQKMVTPVGKRKAVVHLMEVHLVSQQRACDVLQIDRSTVRYLSRRGDDAKCEMQSNACLVTGGGLVAAVSM